MLRRELGDVGEDRGAKGGDAGGGSKGHSASRVNRLRIPGSRARVWRPENRSISSATVSSRCLPAGPRRAWRCGAEGWRNNPARVRARRTDAVGWSSSVREPLTYSTTLRETPAASPDRPGP